MKKPPAILYKSRRCIDEFSQITTIDDLTWDVSYEIWYIHIRVRQICDVLNIPQDTDWYITISDQYPDGNVKVYPSAVNGITDTFYHQNNNGEICNNG